MVEKFYFECSVKLKAVLDYLIEEAKISYLISDSDCNKMFSGVADARIGGDECLVFSDKIDNVNYSNLHNCLVITDALPNDKSDNVTCKVADPRAVFYDVISWILRANDISPFKAGFNSEKQISESAIVSPFAVIESGVSIGEYSIICAGAVIKSGSIIKNNVTIKENACVGVDGISVYRAKDNRLLKLKHLAGVVINDGVEIGSNSVVCRGILSSTLIGDRAIIGNLSNIGHGTIIGDSVWMSVGSLIGGHSNISDYVTLGMGVTVKDNITIGEATSVGMGSVVVKSLPGNTSAFGNPAKRMVGLKTGPAR